jgi:virulence-associated protein VapD
MEFQDTAKLLSMIQRIYPNQVKMLEKAEFEITAKLWQRILNGIDYNSCVEALIVHSRQSQFAPAPSQIYDLVVKIHEPHRFKSGEMAWEEVGKAVRKFGFNRQQEAFETLDEKTKRAVRAIGWWNICYSEKPEFVKKDFISFWDNVKAVEEEQLKLDHSAWLAIQERKHKVINGPDEA